MAGVGFRHLAKTLANAKGSGLSALLTGCRASSGLSKGNLPGRYPKTPEERAAAAKKYNMTVEDYEPYPDKGEGYGDYPKLPDKSQHERDPWYQWDDPAMRRNWGEPMHWHFDLYTRNRVDTSAKVVPFSTLCKFVFGFIGFMVFMFYLGENFKSYQAVAPKHYPYNNLYLEKGGDPEKQPEEVKNYEI